MNLEIDGKWELIALHRIILEAKYNESPVDLDVQGSPFSKFIYEKVFSLLIDHYESEGDKKEVERWLDWRKLDGNSLQIDNLKNRLSIIHSSNWAPLSDENKVEYINCLTTPYLASETLVQELVEFADNVHRDS